MFLSGFNGSQPILGESPPLYELKAKNVRPLADDIGTRKSSNLKTDISQSETATFVILEDFKESMMFKIQLGLN